MKGPTDGESCTKLLETRPQELFMAPNTLYNVIPNMCPGSQGHLVENDKPGLFVLEAGSGCLGTFCWFGV